MPPQDEPPQSDSPDPLPRVRPMQPMSARPVPAKPSSRSAAPSTGPAQSSKPKKPAVLDYPPPEQVPLTFGSLRFRQTIIPPCLVIGLGFIGYSVWYWLQPATQAFGHVNGNIAIVLCIVGVMSLALAIMTMMTVRNDLR